MKILNFITLIIFSFLITTNCTFESSEKEEIFKSDYMGQVLTSDSSEVFAEDLVSNQFNVRDATFSPDGNEFYYSIKGKSFYSIISIKRVNGVWQNPEVASFSGKYSDIEPSFYPDGRKLFFISNRPLESDENPKDYDIWYVEKEDNEWGIPKNLGSPINTEANEFYPSFSSEGTLYFCAKYESGIGGEDLYYSKLIDGKYQDPIILGDSINSTRDEFNAFVAPDESFIMFSSMGWGTGLGGGDIWISFRKNGNSWSRPKNMGKRVNSSNFEYCPSLSPDGKYMFFTSNRSISNDLPANPVTYDEIIEGLNSTLNGSQNIFWIKTDFIKKLN